MKKIKNPVTVADHLNNKMVDAYMKEKESWLIGEAVICCGEKDKIISFITPDDKENYEMGYRVTLENNGTQSFGMISKLQTP